MTPEDLARELEFGFGSNGRHVRERAAEQKRWAAQPYDGSYWYEWHRENSRGHRDRPVGSSYDPEVAAARDSENERERREMVASLELDESTPVVLVRHDDVDHKLSRHGRFINYLDTLTWGFMPIRRSWDRVEGVIDANEQLISVEYVNEVSEWKHKHTTRGESVGFEWQHNLAQDSADTMPVEVLPGPLPGSQWVAVPRSQVRDRVDALLTSRGDPFGELNEAQDDRLRSSLAGDDE